MPATKPAGATFQLSDIDEINDQLDRARNPLVLVLAMLEGEGVLVVKDKDLDNPEETEKGCLTSAVIDALERARDAVSAIHDRVHDRWREARIKAARKAEAV